MQIRFLDQSVYTYIDNNLPMGIGYQCYSVFHLAEQLGLKEYDKTFVDLIFLPDLVEPDEVRDLFIEKVQRLAVECIERHHIKLDEDATATLDELKEILHFLVLVQNLEDPEVISARLHGLGSPRAIFLDVLCQMTHLEKWRAMELIEDVKEQLILAMQQLLQDTADETKEAPDQAYNLSVVALKEFMADGQCLGLTMFEAGFQRLQWQTLTKLIPLDLNKHFEELAKTSIAQCAIDFVSLALVCKDSYQTPSLYLQKVMPQYIDSTETITQIHTAVMSILADYQTTKEVMIQQQKVQEQSL